MTSLIVVPPPTLRLVVKTRPALVVRVGGGGGSSGPSTAVEKAGAPIGTRSALNLIEGTGVTLAVADNPGNDSVDVTVSATATGGVSSFNARTGAVVPTSGDYTATQVGLGSVTNDAQLKRAAGDFATFTAKAVPAGADLVLIEDSAAAGAKKKITVGAIGVIGVWQSATGRTPLWVPPALRGLAPNANDKEFDLDTDVTAAVEVWDVTNSAARTPTYQAIDRSAANVGTGIAPRIQVPSSGRGSFMKIQVSSDVTLVTWPVVVPTNCFVWCSLGALVAAASDTASIEFGLGGSTSGHADRTKSFFAGLISTNSFRCESNGSGATSIALVSGWDYLGVWKLGTTYRGYAFNENGANITDLNPVTNASVMDRWGFLLSFSTGAGGNNGRLAMSDFMRMAPSPVGIIDGV